MDFSRIASRLTGINCPIFGISWNPSEADIIVARRLITVLEDRRVLFEPSHVEVPHYCVESVRQIRELLTDELVRVGEKSDLSPHLRAMRAACRKFLTRVHGRDGSVVDHANSPGHWASWAFYDAVGQMHGVLGVHIAQIAVKYGLDVEDELARILPDKVEAPNEE